MVQFPTEYMRGLISFFFPLYLDMVNCKIRSLKQREIGEKIITREHAQEKLVIRQYNHDIY